MEQVSKGWKRQTVLFLISQCVTLFGSMIVQMAVIWYVTLSTSSGVWVAAFSVCSYLPQFLIYFPAGVWADRYSRRRIIILADAMIAAATLAMACLIFARRKQWIEVPITHFLAQLFLSEPSQPEEPEAHEEEEDTL